MIQSGIRLLSRHSHVNWALADQTMVSGVNFFTGILLARYLGLEEFGRFSLAWLVVLLFNSFQHAMINSPMMSIGSKQPETEAPTYYGAIVVHQLVFSSAIFFLLFAGVRFSDVVFPEWQVQGLALPLATAALATQFQDFLRRYFFTRGRATTAFANDGIRYLGQLAVLIWLFIFFQDGMDTAKVLWVIVIMAAVATAFGAFSVERMEVNAAILGTTASRHWHFSKWLGASSLLNWTSGNFFIVTAGAVLGSSAVGALRAAQNLMGIIHILFQGMENIVPIQASRYYHENGLAKLRAYLGKLLVSGGLATSIIALTFSVAPEFWLTLFFGESYAGHGDLVRWYAAIYIINFLGFPLNMGLRAVEHMKPIFWSYVAKSLFSVTAAYPLIRWWSLTGVMSGILTTQVISFFVLWMGLRLRISQKVQ